MFKHEGKTSLRLPGLVEDEDYDNKRIYTSQSSYFYEVCATYKTMFQLYANMWEISEKYSPWNSFHPGLEIYSSRPMPILSFAHLIQTRKFAEIVAMW
jgi:hypothetical protein